ncbi:low molecular weight phosphotyrosine protein phosphatase [Cyanobium sp. Alchichica 3B3-8F6]|uniref:low molecular weight protein-tyrosine-phosphatase n=1 Tax=Synechococcales TaxID=1890424 RepID=UPI000B987932|nr:MULTISPECIES: low molecular weight protein-tyrosine-phosphatase [Synechococcales]MCP9882817.1 low molecular weight phosphotyrosine protein phosphatase [Cyanobium sp. Alchichica 3B3-8F6]MCP9891155.1 low molecular weight phosphotyrosine protein phosphatase [Cyanobium sp. Aljojuca 7D2]MCP9942075.1 low molecular weight phosphotyrosine protein phosphatase [Cyanobium sp. ATX 6E8]
MKRVLFVCLGNICRSPAAEGVFLHQLTQAGAADRFLVDSAGTGGWHVGKAADPRMRAAASQRGIALTSRARQLELSDLDRFDHILTMDAANLAHVQALAREGRSCAAAGAHGQQARIEPLVGYCSRFDAHEVPDPYYGGEEGFEQVLDLLEDACTGLLQALDR